MIVKREIVSETVISQKVFFMAKTNELGETSYETSLTFPTREAGEKYIADNYGTQDDDTLTDTAEDTESADSVQGDVYEPRQYGWAENATNERRDYLIYHATLAVKNNDVATYAAVISEAYAGCPTLMTSLIDYGKQRGVRLPHSSAS